MESIDHQSSSLLPDPVPSLREKSECSKTFSNQVKECLEELSAMTVAEKPNQACDNLSVASMFISSKANKVIETKIEESGVPGFPDFPAIWSGEKGESKAKPIQGSKLTSASLSKVKETIVRRRTVIRRYRIVRRAVNRAGIKKLMMQPSAEGEECNAVVVEKVGYVENQRLKKLKDRMRMQRDMTALHQGLDSIKF